jgi:hypothetical protein
VVSLARRPGFTWGTVIATVRDLGIPPAEGRDRVFSVASLGRIGGTAFLHADAEHLTSYGTGFVGLERPRSSK